MKATVFSKAVVMMAVVMASVMNFLQARQLLPIM